MLNRLIGFALVAMLALPPLAQAGLMDEKLNEIMPDLVTKLKKKYKNVGTLRFKVEEPGRNPTYSAPLSGSLATRLENMLVVHGGPKEQDALGVIRNAGAVAASNKVGGWSESVVERRKLFGTKYPLAWGTQTVSADAFLTGVVRVSKDRKETTVVLQVIDRKAPVMFEELRTFKFATDRQMLRDLGYNFGLDAQTRGKLAAAKGKARQADVHMVDRIGGQDKPGNVDDAKPTNVGGIALTVLVGGKPVEIRDTPAQGNNIRWLLDSPEPNAPVVFELRNVGDKRLGAVLRLNGVSTINEQMADPENCRKWVLEKGARGRVEGFYVLEDQSAGGAGAGVPGPGPDGAPGARGARRNPQPDAPKDQPTDTPKNDPGLAKSKIVPFKIALGEEAKKLRDDMGDRFGMIELDVFEESTVEPQDISVSARGVPPSQEKKARSSYTNLRNSLLKHAGLRTKTDANKREAIVPDPLPEPMTGPAFKVVSFDRPQLVKRIAIKIAVAPGAAPPGD